STRPLERIGDFRIIREIGRGGMGVVYEAIQESLGRRVALKILPAYRLSNPTLRARFHRESQAAARLHHTNIVPVFSVGEANGLCYYVMQFISGRGLDKLVKDEAFQKDEGGRIEDKSPSNSSDPPSFIPQRSSVPTILRSSDVARIGAQVA